MATGFNTSAQITIVKLFASLGLPALQKTLRMGSLINRAYDSTPGNVGDTVNVPVPPTNVVANDLTEGDGVQYQQTSMSNVQVVVNKHKESSFEITNVAELFSNVDLMKFYIEPAVISVAEQIEADIFSQYTNATGTTVGSQGTPLTSAVIGSAETALYNAKAYGQKYLALTPGDYDVVRALPEFSNIYQIGSDTMVSDALAKGVLGNIKGFDVFRSQLTPSVTVGSPAVTTHYNLAFVPDAIAMVTRKFNPILPNMGAVSSDISLGNFSMQVVMSFDPTTFAYRCSVHALYGIKALRSTFMSQVLS
jgi:hypothetical protein